MGHSIVIQNARLAFASLAQPRVSKDDSGNEKKSYEVSLLLHKKRHAAVIAKINAAIEEICAKEKWPRKGLASECLREADEKISQKTGKPYDGFDSDHVVVSTRRSITPNRNKAPKLVNPDNTVMEPANSRFYSGCYADIQIDLYGVNVKGRRVCASPEMVRFRADGEPLGATEANPEEAFGAALEDDVI
jgi:hypothetical protein